MAKITLLPHAWRTTQSASATMLNMLKQVRGKQGALDADELATQCNELEHSALNFVTCLQHDAVPHPVEAGAEAGVHGGGAAVALGGAGARRALA